MFQTEVVEETKHTFYVQQLFSKNHTIYEITWRSKL